MNIDDFLEIEKKYRLNSLELNGVNYWTYDRFRLWNYGICAESLNLNEPHNKEHISAKKLFGLCLEYIKSCRGIVPKKILVLNHRRRVFNGKTYDCVYTDNLFENEDETIHMESPNQFNHAKPATSKNIFYTDRIVINSTVRVKIWKKLRKKNYKELTDAIKAQISDAVSELKNIYGWQESLDKTCSDLAETVIRCEYEKKVYEKILKKVNPKVVVEVVYYNRSCMIINELSKKMSIPTIELQHGTMYREHAAYQFAEGENIRQLPDYLFAFSDFWKKCISFPIGEDNIIVTGFPNFEKKLNLYSGAERQDKRKTVVFISQGTIGRQLSELASGIASKIDFEKYRLIYKLHPSEYTTWKEELTSLLDTQIEVIDKKDIDLYSVFAQSDIQIGAYSTALFEGMGFGLKTYIYNVGHYDIMLPLIEQGYAGLITSVDECLKAVKDDTSGRVDGSMFWKKDAVSNIRKEIDIIIDKKGK
jgi:hypothetical protein